MAVDPGTPEWWLRILHQRLLRRRPDVKLMRDYHDGQHRLAFASKKFTETFGGLLGAFADNWCQLIVSASVERLSVQGFRVGDSTVADDQAWSIWRRNNCVKGSKLAFTESLVSGEAIMTVWYDAKNQAEITFEPADTAIVAPDPKNMSRRLAGVRFWIDDWGYEHAELFMPDKVYLWRSKTTRRDQALDPMRVHWVPDHGLAGSVSDGDHTTMPNPLGVVPMIPLTANPRLWAPPELCATGSDLAAVIPIQDAVNKLIADLLVASEAGALPMRYATGYEMKFDPKTNEPIQPGFTKPDASWAVLEESTAKLGSLPGADLGNFVKAIETLVQHVASISRTPPHYLTASADRLSGESIKSAETGLVAKVRGYQNSFGENFEEGIRLAGLIEGIEPLGTAERLETIWGDPESRTEGEHIDALMKKSAIGVPVQQLWEEVPYSPEQVRRFPAMLAQQTLNEYVRPDMPRDETEVEEVDVA